MLTPPDRIADLHRRLASAVRRDRLLSTACEIVAVPSPTGDAGRAADRLAQILKDDGFDVERHSAGHDGSPAVVARMESGVPGATLELNGHLDTVHLPFQPPAVDGALLRGSGACDMKGGLAAAVEALRALRDVGLPEAGAVMLVAEDLHEAPWGFGEQLDALIRQGIHGDAVLIPEPLSSHLPLAGRGAAVWKARIEREGETVHEVMRPPEAPSVLAAAADLVLELEALDAKLALDRHPIAGAPSVFVGQTHGGEIYNQLPRTAVVEGTRRWLAGSSATEVERDFRRLCDGVARRRGVSIHVEYRQIRGAFALDEGSRLVQAFDQASIAVRGKALERGAKPFVDDGNSFSALAGIPAITHGPRAGGQHTVHEWVEIDDLVRVAQLYALTAALFCSSQ